jgi:hypothetical protein
MGEFMNGLVIGSFAGVMAMITSMWIANVTFVYKEKK